MKVNLPDRPDAIKTLAAIGAGAIGQLPLAQKTITVSVMVLRHLAG
jgi:hypothetical protein